MWAKCPAGMFLNGIKRTKSFLSWLSNIEELNCCYPKNVAPSYEDCREKSVSFHDQGWTMCDADYYLAGFYRGNCKYLSCLERFKCCKFMPRGMVDMPNSFQVMQTMQMITYVGFNTERNNVYRSAKNDG